MVFRGSAFEWFRRKPTPEFPDSFSSSVGDEDAEEMIGGQLPDLSDLAGSTLGIRYRDSKGQETSRRITVRAMKPRSSTDIFIYAQCHERRAFRTFIYSRVIEITDWSTGEVFTNPDDYFQELFDCSIGEIMANSLRPLNYCRHGITFLSCLAHADGRLLEEEIDILLLYCDELYSFLGIRLSEQNLHEIRNYIIRFEPLEEFAEKAVKHFRRKKKERAILEEYAKKLAAVDGVIDDEEFQLLMKISA